MRKFLNVAKSILMDFRYEVIYFIKSNLRYFSRALDLIVPYIMYCLGMWSFNSRGTYTFGGEVFIPIVIMFVSYFCESFANKIGKGSTLPVPAKRFTMCDEESGEVTVDRRRLQEMLLYMADLEDWLSKKGML